MPKSFKNLLLLVEAPRRPKTAPRRPQRAPKTAQETPTTEKWSQNGTNLASKTIPNLILCQNRLKAKKHYFPYIFLVPLFLSKIINSFNIKLERIVISLVASSVLFYLTFKILFTDYSNNTNYLYFDLIYLMVALLLVLFAISSKKFMSLVDLSKSLLIVIFISFTLLTIKTTNKVIFDLSDEPRDMLIYTQSSPALHNLYEEIEESYIKKDKLIVGIDTMDGFAWPWMWYLREYKNVVWINELNIDNHDYDYLLINQKNFEKLSSESLSNYKFKRIIAHRKWFPESIYRNKSTSDVFKIITTSQSRAKISNYIMNRNFETRIGSTNFVLLKSNNFESIE